MVSGEVSGRVGWSTVYVVIQPKLLSTVSDISVASCYDTEYYISWNSRRPRVKDSSKLPGNHLFHSLHPLKFGKFLMLLIPAILTIIMSLFLKEIQYPPKDFVEWRMNILVRRIHF